MEQNYKKITSYEAKKGEVKKVLLLYSGGLDTSVMLKWVQTEYQTEIITLTVDIGQLADNLEQIKNKAVQLGAKKAIVIDARHEFAENYLAPGIKANACYQGNYHLATPLGRPLIAKLAVEIALQEGCDTIAHGCTGKGNDQVRLEGTILSLAPHLKIIAPVREWNMGREEEIAYANTHGIPISHSLNKIYSYDDNMWGISAEGGEIENPSLIPNYKSILQICKTVEETPNSSVQIELEFHQGIPVKLNGINYSLPSIIYELNALGGEHGVGVVTHVEDRIIGLKIRNIYESPAAHIIINSHKELEKFICTRQENEFKNLIDQKWAYLCYNGFWLEPLMQDLNAFLDKLNLKINGKVTLNLFKGNANIVAIEADKGIFDEKLVTFLKSQAFNQNLAAPFIELYTLQMRMAANR